MQIKTRIPGILIVNKKDMAYNLNYNPGTEYDKYRRHRKILIIFTVALILLAFLILIFVGWNNFKKNKEGENVNISVNAPLTEEQKEQIRRDLVATSTRPLSTQEKAEIRDELREPPPKEMTDEDRRRIREELMR
jgi:cell division septal protein FtsQ